MYSFRPKGICGLLKSYLPCDTAMCKLCEKNESVVYASRKKIEVLQVILWPRVNTRLLVSSCV